MSASGQNGVTGTRLLSCLKQTNKIGKINETVIIKTEFKTTKDNDPCNIGSKLGEPYECPACCLESLSF